MVLDEADLEDPKGEEGCLPPPVLPRESDHPRVATRGVTA